MLKSFYKKASDIRYDRLLYTIVAVFCVLGLRLFYLQVVEGAHYRELADGNRIRTQILQATRGIMYDRNGDILVSSRPVYIVSYTPQPGGMPAEMQTRLATLLAMTPEEIRKKIAEHGNFFGAVQLKADIGQETVARLEEYRDLFPGITIEVQPLRYYPYGDLAAHVVGYVGEAGPGETKEDGEPFLPGIPVGRAGLEGYYDSVLQGTPGGRRVEVDATGRTVKTVEAEPTVQGRNIRLTLDIPLQRATEEAILNKVNELMGNNVWPTGVAAVAMDPNTGAILAMASWPDFNPNSFALGISEQEWRSLNENPLRPFDNRTITGTYPPGSLFKAITGTAALEAKVITPQEIIYDTGKHWLIDKRNAGGEAYGPINFETAMAKSANVYFYELGNRLGIDRIEETARAFGLGQKTGIDLYGEAEGLVAGEAYKRQVFDDDWYLGETFDAAIGQSFHLATPLQMAEVFSEIANGGTRYRPYLVSRIDNRDGSPYRIHTPEVTGRLTVSKQVLDTVRHGLLAVTHPGGTAGHLFAGYPLAVAGKTATSETGGGRDHAWFAAYAPFDKPQIVVVVIVEHAGYGIESAAPITKQMLDAYFRIGATTQKG